MDKSERVIDLKMNEDFIEEYVSLRNRYNKFLLTKAVNVPNTREWLRDDDIEIRGLLRGDTFLGAVILYLNRDGEIAVFVNRKNTGVGSKLLRVISQVAEERNLTSIWAWVLKDNFLARRVFEKNGFVEEGIVERIYDGVTKEGIRYNKILSKKPEQNGR